MHKMDYGGGEVHCMCECEGVCDCVWLVSIYSCSQWLISCFSTNIYTFTQCRDFSCTIMYKVPSGAFQHSRFSVNGLESNVLFLS